MSIYFDSKLEIFAITLEAETIQRLREQNLDCPGNVAASKVVIIPGKKYTKVNVGNSGKYMVDAAGNIFGIKGYGQINLKKQYGTLDTVSDWFWGNYYGQKKAKPELKNA